MPRYPFLFFLALISLVCHHTADAQSRPDSLRHHELPVFDSSHAAQVIDFKALIGTNVSGSINNYGKSIPGVEDYQMSPGLMLRAGILINFNLRSSVVLSTGIEASMSNSQMAMSLINSEANSISSIYQKHRFYQATVPITIGLRLNVGWRMKFTTDVGVYFSKGIGGSTKTSGYTSGTNSLGQPVVNHLYYKSDYFKDDRAIINSVKEFDYGPRISFGMRYRSHFSLAFIMQCSLPNLAIDRDVLPIKYRHFCTGIEFGYHF